MRDLPRPMALAMLNPRSLSFRTFANPRLRRPADLDRAEYRRLEFPAGGAIGSARDIARAYAALVADPPELGIGAETMAEITRFPRPPAYGWHDEVLKVETAFSLGFARPLGAVPLRLERPLLRPSRAPAARSRSATPTGACRSPT